MNPLSTRIDRYPAKMVSRLAVELIDKYVEGAGCRLLDPFCGSGAILAAARDRSVEVVGLDINPYATLLSGVKLDGFRYEHARTLTEEVISRATLGRDRLTVNWKAKGYWFTPGTLDKYERLRFYASEKRLATTPEGRAVLLALALSVRLCSRADHRSPKPFISKESRFRKAGRHLDPFKSMRSLLSKLADLYQPKIGLSAVATADVARWSGVPNTIGQFSHVVTSPPYLNAQDYFRNFKLELYLLEGLLPFSVANLQNAFVGTERGLGEDLLFDKNSEFRRELVPQLCQLEESKPKLARVVHKYVEDMWCALGWIRRHLRDDGRLIIVCGDNLVGGIRIRTWEVVNEMICRNGLKLFDQFGDRIVCRAVPPTRLGHKGLIKEEIVSAFVVDKGRGIQ